MPELKVKSRINKRAKKREFVFTSIEQRLLKEIGLHIQNELHKQNKSLEWLSFKIGVSRSALQEIVAGRSNPRLLTLFSIAVGLGFKSITDFLANV
jgi:transcriptional regulator with XRE-family HTH domain